MKTKDNLWFLAALIPVGIIFGPILEGQQWGSWVLVAGLGGMFAYITCLHRRLAALEKKSGEST